MAMDPKTWINMATIINLQVVLLILRLTLGQLRIVNNFGEKITQFTSSAPK